MISGSVSQIQTNESNAMLEIERKWLIDFQYVPTNIHYDCQVIKQLYLKSADGVSIRVRTTYVDSSNTSKGFITVKYPSQVAGAVNEAEMEIPAETAAVLIGNNSRTISKTRYLIKYGDHIIELDKFDAPHSGLIIAEVEFESVEQMKGFIRPAWFGEEVTGNHRYSNSYLGRQQDSRLQKLWKRIQQYTQL